MNACMQLCIFCVIIVAGINTPVEIEIALLIFKEFAQISTPKSLHIKKKPLLSAHSSMHHSASVSMVTKALFPVMSRD